jgi:hypothetical protein
MPLDKVDDFIARLKMAKEAVEGSLAKIAADTKPK